MKAVVAAFNQEKALVGAFSVIVQPVVEPMENYTALHQVQGGVPAARGGVQVGGQSAVVISATCYVRVHCILNILQHVPYSYELGS